LSRCGDTANGYPIALTVSQRDVSVVISRILGLTEFDFCEICDPRFIAGKAEKAEAEPTMSPVFFINSLLEVFFIYLIFRIDFNIS
jgi:hypothetical protein